MQALPVAVVANRVGRVLFLPVGWALIYGNKGKIVHIPIVRSCATITRGRVFYAPCAFSFSYRAHLRHDSWLTLSPGPWGVFQWSPVAAHNQSWACATGTIHSEAVNSYLSASTGTGPRECRGFDPFGTRIRWSKNGTKRTAFTRFIFQEIRPIIYRERRGLGHPTGRYQVMQWALGTSPTQAYP